MILFANDWAMWPTAKPNLETTNKSFVRLSSLYRSMGVKNHAFLLALVNQDLVGVDPFDPDLSLEQMAAIALECKINPWFYFREVVRIPGLGTHQAKVLEGNRGNIALFWLFFNHVTTVLIQPRQTGKSVSTDTLMNLLMNVLCQNTAINLLTKDDDLRKKNIERIKKCAEELPVYLQQRTRDDTNNTMEVSVKSLGNTYNAHVPQESEKRALNMGRGLTSPIFHIDEGPFQKHIRLAYPTALAAGGAAVEAAQEQGTPYGTILTTTAGKKDDEDGKFIYNLLSEAAYWTEMFFDCKDLEDLHATIRRNSRGRVCRVNATFDHRQLGKTDQWLKEELERTSATGEEADRDYFNRWTSGSQSHPLSTNLLEKITASRKPHQYVDISKPHGYITRWYIPEEEIEERMQNGKYVMGMDTSDASGGDDISLVITDVDTLDVVAVGTYNETNFITFSQWVCSVLVAYPSITAIIEKRSSGQQLIDYLLHWLPQFGIDPFKRLFNWIVNDHMKYKEQWKEIQNPLGRRASDIYDRYKALFGFATSGSGATSRSELYSTTLVNAAKRGGDKVYDGAMIDQIAGLITRNGRVDHPVGEHDDMVIGWLLGHYLLHQGRNLSYYGIEKTMTQLVSRENETRVDYNQRMEQQEIREEIEEIMSLLSDEEDDYVVQRMEQRMKYLSHRLILEVGEIYSFDDLIKKAKEARRNRRKPYGSSSALNQQNSFGYRTQNFHMPIGMFSDKPLSSRDILGYH